MKHAPAAVAALVLVLVAAAARARETRPEHAGWEESAGVLDWVVSPPPREGFVRVVDAGQSNLLSLAYPLDLPSRDALVRRAIRTEVARRLRALLGKDADAVAEAVPETATLVRKGFHLAPPERGKPLYPGATTYTAWVLWEVPAPPLLAAVPEAKREEARRALDRAGVPEEPAWESVDAKPAWVDEPPEREGHLTVATHMVSDRAEVAKADAWVVTGHLGSAFLTKLRALLGPDGSWRVGHAAESWRTPRKRAVLVRTDGRDSETWTLWDVPLEPVLDAVPQAQRDAARALLAPPAKPR